MSKDIESLAEGRANAILESWWFEDTGEWQAELELTNEEMDLLLNTDIEVRVVKRQPAQTEET